uniref:SAP domain-containing protein n=1 Tax=Fagus sylvatica TaxID=28930 RepID=A0A2N9EJE0_FAGSY
MSCVPRACAIGSMIYAMVCTRPDISQAGIIAVRKVATADNPADMMTKLVPLHKFKHCLDLVGVLQSLIALRGFGGGSRGVSFMRLDCIQAKVEICYVCGLNATRFGGGSFIFPGALKTKICILATGRIVELLEALEALAKDNQPIPPRAMILSRKYRTLVSSWIEPLQEEAELGYEIDYISRYIAEGGLTGERKRWVPRRGKTPLDPDAAGFIYSNPMETSFKQRCLEDWKEHHRKLLKTLQNEGPSALGDASESDYIRVEEWLKKILKGPDQNILKPKAASKMLVSELKEELEAQDLPTDGTRNVLYQRVQKARRINRSRGRPLWVPPIEEEEEEVDEELDELISRIKLEEGNTEFWKRRFLGEGFSDDHEKPLDMGKLESPDVLDDGDAEDESPDVLDDGDVEDVSKEVEDDEADEEEEVEQTESQDGDRAKDKEVEAKKPLQMIGVQLLKDSDQTTTSSKKSRRRASRISVEV